MPKFRKKPVVIEAVQWTGKNYDEIREFNDKIGILADGDIRLVISTLEGDMQAIKGDWIIKGIMGEFYPCKPAIFEATYEPVIERDLALLKKEILNLKSDGVPPDDESIEEIPEAVEDPRPPEEEDRPHQRELEKILEKQEEDHKRLKNIEEHQKRSQEIAEEQERLRKFRVKSSNFFDASF